MVLSIRDSEQQIQSIIMVGSSKPLPVFFHKLTTWIKHSTCLRLTLTSTSGVPSGTMINEGALDRVRQFVFEIHTNEVNGKPSSVQDFYDMAEILLEIEKIGFRRFHYHYNKFGKYRSVRTGIQRTCCYELYYININFLNDN